jgi:chromosome segregation ATPase
VNKTIEQITHELDELQEQIDRVIEERQRLERRLLDKVKSDKWAEIVPITSGALHFVHMHLKQLAEKRRELREQKRELTAENHCECCQWNNVDLDT